MATSVPKPRSELTAADVMTPTVVSVRAGATVREAARRLAEARVSGAPVVDADGWVIGVFSLTDVGTGEAVVRCQLEAGHCLLQREGRRFAGHSAPIWCALSRQVMADWQLVQEAVPPAVDVRHHMTAVPVTVPRDALLFDLARLMSEVGVHRVIVIDDRRPVGVVSTLGAARAIAGNTPNDFLSISKRARRTVCRARSPRTLRNDLPPTGLDRKTHSDSVARGCRQALSAL